MQQYVRASLGGSVALLAAAELAGPWSRGAAGLIAAAALATAVASRYAAGEPRRRHFLRLAAPVLPLLVAWRFAPQASGLPVAAVVAGLGLAAWLQPRPEGARHLREVAVAIGGVAAVFLAAEHLGTVWRAIDAAAAAISAAARALRARPLELGPTFAGVWPGLLAAAAVLARTVGRVRAGEHRRVVLAGAAAALTLIVAALVLWAGFLPEIESGLNFAVERLLAPPTAHDPLVVAPGVAASIGGLLLTPLLVLLGLLALDAFGRGGAAETSAAAAPPARRRLAVGAGALAAAFATFLMVRAPLPAASPTRVVFLDRGMLDFSMPSAASYGLGRAGMFGAFERYLESAGYRTGRMVELNGPSALDGIDVLVVVNPREGFTERELATLWNAVERGMGLLVMGDHTDLAGIQAPLDQLLAPIGVRFEFDSAFALRRHWRQCQSFRPHPLTGGLRDYRDTRIGTGASLRLAGSVAEPVIVGRYAFGDLGNRANSGAGAYLGDYRYQQGERLGDVVLMAVARHGEGRVAVLGDTSSFQNLYMPQAYGFAERTVRYLGSPPRPGAARLLGLGLLLLGCGVALMRPTAEAAVALVVAIAAGAGLGTLGGGAPARLPAARVALIDYSHVEDFPLELWEEQSIGGLVTALYRSGLLPLVEREGGARSIDGAAFVAYVSPMKPPSRSERAALERLLGRGGTVFVAAGARGREAANELLTLCGLRLTDLPLGPAEATVAGPPAVAEVPTVAPASVGAPAATPAERLRFVDAWALESNPPTARGVRAAVNGHAVAAEVAVGPGRCIAFGDARFFEDGNLEGENQFHRANVEFLQRLLDGGDGAS